MLTNPPIPYDPSKGPSPMLYNFKLREDSFEALDIDNVTCSLSTTIAAPCLHVHCQTPESYRPLPWLSPVTHNTKGMNAVSFSVIYAFYPAVLILSVFFPIYLLI